MRTETLTPRLLLADVVCAVVVAVVALSPLQSAYGGWRWLLAAAVGTLVGLGVAWVSRRAGWGPWLTALVLVAAYLLLGPALAVPDRATAGVLPGPDSLRALLTGAVQGWRESLTLITPLGSAGTVLVVPWILALLTGLLIGLVLWRSSAPGAAALVPLATFAAAAAFGDRLTELTLARGLALGIALLLWTRWRATRDVRVAWLRRIALTTAVIAVAGGLAGGLTMAMAGDTREVLRDHVDPPFDPLDYPSPLSRYRAYYDDTLLGEKTMFTTQGLVAGDRIRLATMDTFDGLVWNVAGGPQAATQSGTFRRIAPGDQVAGEQQVTIAIEDYTGPWVPTVGDTLAVTVRRDGESDGTATSRVLYNAATGTAAQLGGVTGGLTYDFRVSRPKAPTDPTSLGAGPGARPEAPPEIPPLTKRVQSWLSEAGSPSGGAAAQMLAEQFRLGFFSDGKAGQAQSASGHGVKRLTDLMGAEQMIGNDEQYASAMAVAAQQQGLSARVVLGFVVPDATGVVKGADVHAWVEVDLEGAGWVAFAPTPDKDRTPKEQKDNPQPQPQPNVIQPPVIPEEPDDADKKTPQGAGKKVEKDPNETLAQALAYAGYVTGGVALTSPLWGLLLLKRVRRRRRRRAGDPLNRVSGGWREVADRARDLGVRLPESNTRNENGRQLLERYPTSGAAALAARADHHVFGPWTPDDQEVRDYWNDVDTALKRMRKESPLWRRPLAVLSPASIPWRATVRSWAGTAVSPVRALFRKLRKALPHRKEHSTR